MSTIETDIQPLTSQFYERLLGVRLGLSRFLVALRLVERELPVEIADKAWDSEQKIHRAISRRGTEARDPLRKAGSIRSSSPMSLDKMEVGSLRKSIAEQGSRWFSSCEAVRRACRFPGV